MVHDQDPVAEPLDVAHVVRREQQRRAVLATLGDEELAQPLLGQHVQADRRLVEDHQVRAVQQRGRDLGAHALPQGQLPHRRGQELPHLQHLDELGGPDALVGGGQGVDRGQDRERLPHRQVPPQLRALPEHHTDPAGEHAALLQRVQPHGRDPAARGHEDADQHLDGGRLPGPVGADVAHGLARPDGQVEVVDGDVPRAPQPVPAFRPPGEHPGQALGLDDVHPPAPR